MPAARQARRIIRGTGEKTCQRHQRADRRDRLHERPSWYFDPYQAKQRLLKHFGTATLEGFGIRDADGAIIPPAGALSNISTKRKRPRLPIFRAYKKVSRKKFLHIDHTSLRSLEILRTIRTESTKGTLLDCLDSTLTPMGGRMFRNWLCRPLCDLPAIELRQDAVAELKDSDNRLIASPQTAWRYRRPGTNRRTHRHRQGIAARPRRACPHLAAGAQTAGNA